VSDEDCAGIVLNHLENGLADPNRNSNPDALRHFLEQEAAKLLVAIALQRGSGDNITALVVFV